jgi:hypothetical protein
VATPWPNARAAGNANRFKRKRLVRETIVTAGTRCNQYTEHSQVGQTIALRGLSKVWQVGQTIALRGLSKVWLNTALLYGEPA